MKTSAFNGTYPRAARVYRGFLITLIATAVAAISHVLAGGNVPTLIALIVTATISLPLVVLLMSKRLGVFGTLIAVGFTQALFHTIFVYAGTGLSSGSGEALPAHAEHLGMMQQFIPVLPGSGADLLMWFSHAIATFVTVWIIYQGESALIKMERALGRVFFGSFTDAVYVKPAPVIRVGFSSKSKIVSSFLRCAFNLRGPPVENIFKHNYQFQYHWFRDN